MASSTTDGTTSWELRYRHLADALKDPVISIDHQGRITEWNPAAQGLFGYGCQEVLGSPLSDVIGLPCPFPDLGEEEVTLRRRDGSKLLCEVSAGHKVAGAEGIVTLILRDVSDRRRTGNLLRAQRSLALSLTRADTPEQGLVLACETAMEVSEMECGAAYLENRQTGRLRLVFHKGVSSGFAETLFDDAESDQTRSAKAGTPMYAGGEEMERLFQDPAAAEGIRALAIAPIWGEDGHIGCLCTASREINGVPDFTRNAVERLAALTGGAIARLKAKIALRDSQERLQLAQAAGRVVLFDCDLQTNKIVWTPWPEAMAGSSESAFENSLGGLMRRIHPEDAARLQVLFRDWLCSERDEAEFEYRFFRSTGEMRWRLSNAMLIRNGEGQALRMVGTSVDITGRKRTENLLNAERNLARGLSRAASVEKGLQLCTEAAIEAAEMDCGWVYLVDWRAGTLSLAFHKGLTKGLQELVARLDVASMDPRLVRIRPLFLRRGDAGLPISGSREPEEVRSMAAVSIWSENRIVACLNLGSFTLDDVPPFSRIAIKRIAGQTGTYIAGLNAEASLRESEEKYRRLFEDSKDAIFIASPEGRIRECNEAFCRLLGCSREEASNLRIGDVLFKSRRGSSLRAEIEKAGSVKDFELKLKKKDGRGADCLITASRKYSQKGLFVGYEGIIRDVTERRQLELEVMRVGSFERRKIGQDLHDNIGQQLTGIALKAKSLAQSLASRSLPGAQDALRLVDLVNGAIGQVRDLAKGLVPVELGAGGLCIAIRELAESMRDVQGISCEAFFSPETIDVGALAGMQLFRIAQEAVINSYRHSRAKLIRISLTQSEGVTTLRVEDDGIGITDRSKRRKGLGLHLMKYRAELINSSLEVKNRLNGGTMVECVVGEQEAVRRRSRNDKEEHGGGRENDKDTDRR